MPQDATTLFAQNELTAQYAAASSHYANAEPAQAVTLWAKCLDIIRDNINPQVFRTWFENIRALSWNGSTLLIQVPSQFYYEWIEEHYGALLRTVLTQILGSGAELQYEVIVDKSQDTTLEDRTITLPAFRQQATPSASSAQAGLPFVQQQAVPQNFPTYLNPSYVFENFIRGESNQLAVAAAIAIAENPGKTKYNPLVIYGNTGLGKTHLVQAIGNRAQQLHRNIRVFYTNSERFTMEYVNAIQNGKINEFANFYRSIDILVVDDIQFFSGKEKTQDNFFHTFNALHQSGKQIILTSDKPPKDIHGVDDRLISRFQWGLTADVQPPDYEMRLAILQRKAADEGTQLPGEVIEYLARNITSSVRELEGCLISLLAKVSLDGRELTIDLAREVVKGIASEQPTKEMTVKAVLNAVSEYYDIPLTLITGKTRKQEVVVARQTAMYIIKQHTQLSLKSIGSHFGGRDHTTVIHSCQMVKNYLDTDSRAQNAMSTILERLGAQRRS
ncbi:MAG: chromosomal replication initiator protein DnaA [Ignavibacteria bacterium]|nr:chromosomal replication initiator protein DnaA [Ignavibacteria bacterium]MBL7991632.1 chromosomal replication initiator protein DnaA [Candidatus Kapabacteria bacterium]